MTVHRFLERLLIFLTLWILLTPANMQIVSGQAGAVAALDPLQGVVQHRAADAPENAWQTLTRLQIVSEGDWIRTDHLGKAELVFFEGNLITILPNTQIQIAKFSLVDADSPDLVIEQPIGDVRHQIGRILDSDSRYEVDTPSAVIAVRGTDFWSSSTWLSETSVNVSQGITEIKGVGPDGTIGASSFITQDQSLYVRPDGQAGMPGVFTQPQEPPSAPLAPATCGDTMCDPGEEQVCAVDCQAFPTCGNGICELQALEGPVTCALDCVPAMRGVTQPDTTDTTQVVPTVTPRPTPSQPCTVRATRSDIEVRVGPGFNRGVRDYLKANVDIPVVGKATDSEGNLWWKIQPPGYIPAEADRYWVRADDVQESGNCDAVLDTAASPIVAPPPPRQPTQGPNPTVGPGPTLPPMFISFYADKYVVDTSMSECAIISWDVEGIREVYFQGSGVVGHSSQTVCPSVTTTYELRVVLVDGSTTYRYVTITAIYP